MFNLKFLNQKLILLCVGCSSATEITYRKVVDTGNQLPDVAGSWSGFLNPAISNGKIAFLAYQPFFSPLSLFAEMNSQLTHIASHGSMIPGDGRTISMTFSTVSNPVFHKDKIYWEVLLRNDSATVSGVVEFTNGQLRLAFDEPMASAHAGTPLSWRSYNDLSIGPDERVVRALGSTDGHLWLIGYSKQNLVTVNAGTSLPPSTTWFPSAYTIYQEGFVINPQNGPNKFLRDHLGNLQNPDAGLTQLISPSVLSLTEAMYGNGRWFAFQGRLSAPVTYNQSSGIFGWAANKWFKVARIGDAATDGTVITYISDIGAKRNSIDADSLLFTAGTSDGEALFLFRSGQLHRILSPGDFLDGQEVVSIHTGRNSLEGDFFGFVAHFTNGKKAVYVGDLSQLDSPSNTTLTNQITLKSPHCGEVKTPTSSGRVYHFYQSDDLHNWLLLRSVQGSSSVETFNFDNSIESPIRRFYKIEEAVYSR